MKGFMPKDDMDLWSENRVVKKDFPKRLVLGLNRSLISPSEQNQLSVP